MPRALQIAISLLPRHVLHGLELFHYTTAFPIGFLAHLGVLLAFVVGFDVADDRLGSLALITVHPEANVR